jgi:sulfite reductase (ferredoxin)
MGVGRIISTSCLNWDQEEKFKTEIGVGECAGVMIDLVATLVFEAEEKQTLAEEALDREQYGDSIYYSYAAFVSAAKALLLDKQVHCNTQIGIIEDFDRHFGADENFSFGKTFSEQVLQINKEAPSKAFAFQYFRELYEFLQEVKKYRERKITIAN